MLNIKHKLTDARMRRPKLAKMVSIESMKSADSASEDSLPIEEKPKEEVEPSTWQIMRLCEPEKYLMMFGVLSAIAVGSSFPMFAVLFGETYGVRVPI